MTRAGEPQSLQWTPWTGRTPRHGALWVRMAREKLTTGSVAYTSCSTWRAWRASQLSRTGSTRPWHVPLGRLYSTVPDGDTVQPPRSALAFPKTVVPDTPPAHQLAPEYRPAQSNHTPSPAPPAPSRATPDAADASRETPPRSLLQP